MIPSMLPSRTFAMLAAVLSMSVLSVHAQAPTDSVKFGWKRQCNAMLNLSQAYYDKWSKGGTDALSYEWNVSGSSVLDREKDQWDTKAKAVYGRNKIGSLASRKSSDEFDLESIYTYKLATMVNPYASLAAQTQFMPGYKYPGDTSRVQISDSFDPTYFIETVGVGITPYPGLKERLGATMKQTLSSVTYAFADDKETAGEVEDFKQEYGLTSITEYAAQLMENIKGTTRFEVFVNFKGIDEVDRRWTNQITAKVNSLVNVNFEYELLYDADLIEDTQTREVLSVGISLLKL